MAEKSICSTDAKTWQAPDGAGNPLTHGPSLTVYRGELWGSWVTSQQNYEDRPYLFKYNNGKMPAWSGNINLPSTWKVLGRTGITTMDDKFYLSYRGTSGRYWVARSTSPSSDTSWTTVNPGSLTSSWAYSPSCCAFQGSIYVVGAVEGGEIYYTRMSPDGTIEHDWSNFSNSTTSVKTVQSPALTVHNGVLYMIYTAENSQQFWYCSLTTKGGDWTTVSSTPSFSSIGSSPSCAVHTDGKLYLVFSAQSDGAINYMTFDGSTFSSAVAVNSTARAAGACGVGSHNGYLYITYGQKSTTTVVSARQIGEGHVVDKDEDSDDDSIYNEKQAAQRPAGPDPAGKTDVGFRWDNQGDRKNKTQKRWIQKLLCF